MSRPHSRWGALAIGVALVALAGCAADPVPEVTAALPTPTPTPTYVQPAEPASTLPLGCADLLALSFVQEHIPGEPLAVSVDESSAPAGSAWAGFATAGGLRCVWGGSGRTDGGYDQGLSLAILGDGTVGFEAWAAQNSIPVTWSVDAFGDRSMTHCDEFYQNGCYGGVVVDGYWIDFSVRESTDRTVAQADANLAALLEPVVAAVRGAGAPTPAWVPPADTYTGADLCDPAVAATLVGGPVTVAAAAAPDGGIASVGFARAGTSGCIWESSVAELQSIRVTVYPGGAWMFPRLLAEPDEAGGSYLSTAVPTQIAGTDGALTARADMVWSAMSLGGSLVEVLDTATYEPSNLLPVLQRIADHAAS